MDNPEKFKKHVKTTYENRKHKHAAEQGRRRASKLQATPKWADLDKIKLIYKEAHDLQKLDGIKRHVDHIIPLNHDKICGLHVENNLQILTAEENIQKSNNFEIGG